MQWQGYEQVVVDVTVLAYGVGVKMVELVLSMTSPVAMMSGGDVDVEPFLSN
jgi:hypothetical protein